MHILHGTWIPQAEPDFIQRGTFNLWIETTEPNQSRKSSTRHPHQLPAPKLAQMLKQELGIPAASASTLEALIAPQYFLLPTAAGQPLPSLELSRYLETEPPATFELQAWEIDCYPTLGLVKGGGLCNTVVPLLKDLHFLALHNLAEVQLGIDLLFWFQFTQGLKRVIYQDHYIPALRYRQLTATPSAKRRSTKTTSPSTRQKKNAPAADPFEIYPGWAFVGDAYDMLIREFVEYMPLACVAGFETPPETPTLYDRTSLLRHFSECLLTEIVTHTPTTQAFEKTIADSLVMDCLYPTDQVWTTAERLEQYQQWQGWCDRIHRTHTEQHFNLCFQLQDPTQPEDPWMLQFQIEAKEDPSLRLALQDYWQMNRKQRQQVQAQMGQDLEQQLLLNLGYAARIYSDLWRGLETDQPREIALDLEAAFGFLKEAAWVLENAGYKVRVPAWWTPQGRQRAKVRLNAKGKSASGSQNQAKSYFSLDRLVEYQYELAIGDEPISEQEWHQLVNAKTPLVRFRGQWMELDQDKMAQMLAFWQTHQQENPELSLLDFLKLTASTGSDDLTVEVDRDDSLAEMLTHLGDKTQLQPVENPAQLQGQLREYQKRGVAWLQFLEQLGLNGCLADDMGLGKTIQVIARLLQEREQSEKVPPTLLVAPTSVVGNWQREIQKFAPPLKAAIHHGNQRAQEAKDFKALCRDHDVLITSFALARKDAKLLSDIQWHRIVLDEAQNIKNPKASVTKSILKLSAPHRLALTGTPVENRLLDLWSIFHFLNPGYLGTQTQFRRSFELPIQKENDPRQSVTLKKLVEPFILRRVKTDQAIIKDLPAKVEQKLYCNLTQEQASLYEAVVKDVTGQLDDMGEIEGIQRQGLILSTLLKLKQICNHPRQFLQDGSEFAEVRSHKLSRLNEMVQEAIDDGDSLLIFTQFTELGEALEKHLRQTYHYNTYYLHGGTSRTKREGMIAEFQDPETEPSIFVLSLKAGGVGITLTKANHVFHFDRWWNPAVEDQATDRAFRIGQQKSVFVHKFVAIGTLEERIDEMIEDKKKLAGSIVGADESWLTKLDNNAFKELIALNRSAIMA
ncbi:DEAD/DEAH box helicase family protein [Synechococcales cyanobacterium C]|uniref:DEAD/DEAH box helicase family protein n=1 Tax=Petrachloros mirabilis ULC683 TaxID=2781853 RepID=A0A8K2A6E3_9CYAN|nr:DEAD/DEAH box helicase [Petrachloros mirabilis]NCJ05826.1 DEAD/DEAH box helicase family protein [Petrachloros mirabilis ULC683]